MCKWAFVLGNGKIGVVCAENDKMGRAGADSAEAEQIDSMPLRERERGR